MSDPFYGQVIILISSFALAGIVINLALDFFFPRPKIRPYMPMFTLGAWSYLNEGYKNDR